MAEPKSGKLSIGKYFQARCFHPSDIQTATDLERFTPDYIRVSGVEESLRHAYSETEANGGHVVTAPMFFNVLSLLPFTDAMWKSSVWFTLQTEVHRAFDEKGIYASKGEEVAVFVHGPGIMHLDRFKAANFENYWRGAPNLESNPNYESGAMLIADEEMEALLDGYVLLGNPNIVGERERRPIDIVPYSSDHSTGERNYAVVVPASEINLDTVMTILCGGKENWERFHEAYGRRNPHKSIPLSINHAFGTNSVTMPRGVFAEYNTHQVDVNLDGYLNNSARFAVATPEVLDRVEQQVLLEHRV